MTATPTLFHIAQLETRVELSEQRMLAAFRGELNTAITGQTRTMIYTMAGTVLSTVLGLAGLAVAVDRL